MSVAHASEARPLSPRKKTPAPAGQPAPKRKQYNVGVSPETGQRIDTVAKDLGLDEVNFLRLMIAECLPIYERRAQAVRDRKPPE